ncbi:metabotropic glutamate receptor 5-like [Lineus longissimus]|uniref:metabotropic glutamate receptor 5-like n=1 Tax=Lineus longissimus TaxID=88925 RepID=UPI00315CB735
MFGYSIRNLINENCPNALTDKSLLKDCVNGSLVNEYVYKTTFNGYLENMKINKDGDGMGQYEVLQQIRKGTGFEKVKVGVWVALTSSLSFTTNVTWTTRYMLDNHGIPESVCSKPCDPGYFRLLSDSPCCWVCKKCRSNEFVTINGSACDVCNETTWPNSINNTCDEIQPMVPGWAAITTIVFMCFATIGLLLVIVIGTLYIVHRNDRIIKASSLSLSCVILSGVVLSYITVYLVLSNPCSVVCSIQRQTFSWSFILIYAPILVKSNRIYRIFTAGKQGNKRPNLIGGKAQLVFSFIIISIQVTISIVTAAVLPPTPTLRQPIMIEKRVELTCDLPFYALIIPLCYNLLVVLVAAFFGYKTRKLPENFNESKCIFLSVCSTVFIWIAFMPTYFAAMTAQHKILLLASSLVLNATVIILCLFVTRVYALFYMDEDDMLFMTMTRTRVAPMSQISAIAS